MKLIKSNYEIIEQQPGLDGIYKAIESAGRVYYLLNLLIYLEVPHIFYNFVEKYKKL